MIAKRCTREDLKQLLASEGGPHLTIYLPPPIIRNDTLEEEKTRLSNLIRSAHSILTRYWMSEIEAVEFLRPLEALSVELWQQNPRRHGIAIFVSSGAVHHFRLEHSLDEQWIVQQSFAIRPLLPCLDEPDPFVLLTLSQQRTALFQSSSDGLQRISGLLPESFEELQSGLTVVPKTQVRSVAVGGRAGQGVVYHGQGGSKDAEKVDLENYLKHVDRAVCAFLQRHPGTELVLAGVDTLTAMYRAISHCNCILDETVSGNVDNLSDEELGERATALAKVKLHQQRKQCALRMREHDVVTAIDPGEILVAATTGRIDSLFIDQSAQLNGIFESESGKLTEVLHPLTGDPADCSCDLIELAAARTLRSGGKVYSVPASEMPAACLMMAALRY